MFCLQGYAFTLPGPTLVNLAELLHIHTAPASFILVSQSIGGALGAPLAILLKKWIHSVLLMGMLLFLFSVAEAGIPFSTHFALTATLSLVSGLCGSAYFIGLYF